MVTKGCRRLPKVAKGCQRLPKVAKGCQKLPKLAKGYQSAENLDTFENVSKVRPINYCVTPHNREWKSFCSLVLFFVGIIILTILYSLLVFLSLLGKVKQLVGISKIFNHENVNSGHSFSCWKIQESLARNIISLPFPAKMAFFGTFTANQD